MQVLNQTLLNLKKVFQKEALERVVNHYGLCSLEYKKFKYVMDYNEVIFSHKNDKSWGSYDHAQHLIILNDNICFLNKNEAIGIYLHELCHAYFGDSNIQSHGRIFKKMCKKLGISEFDAKAVGTYALAPTRINNLSGKVKKLLAMAESSNQNESEVAMQKAYMLLNKYNLDEIASNTETPNMWQEERFTGKRTNAMYSCIRHILSDVYHVYIVREHRLDGKYFEICGDKTNVEIAVYVFDFLEKKLPELYSHMRYKGKGAKGSFYNGFAHAFTKKYENETPVEESTALVVYQEQVEYRAKSLFYHGVKLRSRSRPGFQVHQGNFGAGYRAGQNTNINPGVRNQGQALLA